MKIKKPTTDCVVDTLSNYCILFKMPFKTEKLMENEFNGTLSTFFLPGDNNVQPQIAMFSYNVKMHVI